MGVFIDVTKPLATVRVGPPERHDALDLAGWRALADAFQGLSHQSDVGCVVVRGTGGRALSGGSDVTASSSADGSPEDAGAYAQAIAGALRHVRMCPHPTVAIVEGMCVGGGLEIAACCDLRVCGESSRFGAPLDRLALGIYDEEPEPLEQLLGGGALLETLLGGELIDAQRALVTGLVNRVHPDRAVVEQGYGLAARIAAGAPLVNRWHKRAVQRLLARAAD
jgi:enoyl-CoA hydratase/carnithine racemase